MVAIHPGMTDQTNSNIARDGAAKRPQASVAIAHGMKDQVSALSGVSPANPGIGPDADPANPLSPSPKLKKFPDAPKAYGMKGAHDNASGHAVLAEASNLGR